MWDLTIPGDHDFYIDTMTAAILVHNSNCEPPGVDSTGKVHGKIPSYIPSNWTKEQLEQLEADLEQSIRTRKQGLIDLGEDAAHSRRLQEETRLLRQVKKKLSGS